MNTIATERVIGLSISNSPDLAERGFGAAHLHELMITIARALFRLGDENHEINLAYGGDLHPGGFTETLFDLARAETQKGWGGLIYSYLAWPYYLDLPKSDEARRLNICGFIRITPKIAGFADYADDVARNALPTETANLIAARCLSVLREFMTEGGLRTMDGTEPKLAARVVLGGQITGYSGIMPGIFEEFMLAGQAKIPIFVAGGFGGAAQALADAVLGPPEDLPKVFDLNEQLTRTDGLEALSKSFSENTDVDGLQQPYDQLAAQVTAYRDDLDRADESIRANGLTRSENELLMTSQRVTEITGMIERGLRRVWGLAD